MSQYNILVVDDDREIVRSLDKLLELEGYRVKKAYNGMEALDILMTEQIHLILLDVMMPKMNGLSALMKIREKNNIPIIMLSAKTEESDKVIGPKHQRTPGGRCPCSPDRNRVQNYGASDGASRLRILSRRNLQPGLAGGCLQRRKYRHGSYPAHS